MRHLKFASVLALTATGFVAVDDPAALSAMPVQLLTDPFFGPHVVRSTVTPQVYVSDPATNSVKILTPGGALTGTLTGFNSPAGLAVDNRGNLYVADQGNQVIKVFAPGKSTPIITLDDSGFYPTGIVTDAADNVYVASVCSGSPGTVTCTGPGSVYKYPKGSSAHSTVYDTSAIRAPYYVAFEGNGKLLWADGWTAQDGAPVVGHWSSPKSFVASNISIVWPGGIQFDKNDNLAVDDQLGPSKVSTLYVFPHGAAPASSSFPLWTGYPSTNCDIVSFALAPDDAAVWTACFEIVSGHRFVPGVSEKMAYPGGGSPTKSIANGTYGSGIAVAPVSGN